MAKAKKLPSGNWRTRVYIGTDNDGKKIYKSFTAATKKEAEFLATEYLINNKEAVERKILGALIDQYIEDRVNVLSPNTIKGYRKIRRCNFQSLMDVSIDKIDNRMLQQAINQEVLGHSPKTVINAFGLINTVLKQNSYYRYNVSLPKKQKKIKNLPEPKVIFDLVKGTDIELPCLLAMWLSFRMSEIKGFRKCDIVNGVITVNNTMYLDENNVERLKNVAKTVESRRSIALPNYILELIDKLPAEQEFLVPMKAKTIYDKFVRLLKNNNVQPITFHDLRSINASVMLMLGVPDKYAMERGGWETDNILKNVYQQTFSKERQAVDTMIDNYFNTLL